MFTLLALVVPQDYIPTNLAVGIGIAADAMVATIARFTRFRGMSDALKWASSIGLTHAVFPMIGFVGLWYVADRTTLEALVYGAGALIMVWFIASVLKEVAGLNTDEEEEGGRVTSWLQKFSTHWALVWAVSVDALVSGPGKTAATAHWTESQVWWSFAIVGGVVFLLVAGSAIPAMWLRRRWSEGLMSSPLGLARFQAMGVWVELSIFTYFACLSTGECARALGVPVPGFAIFAVALGLIAAMHTVFGRRIWQNQLEEATEVIAA